MLPLALPIGFAVIARSVLQRVPMLVVPSECHADGTNRDLLA